MPRVAITPSNLPEAAGYKSEADQIADERGGKCVSTKVQKVTSRVWWKCKHAEHPAWRAAFFDIRGRKNRKGGWCRHCANEAKRRHSLDDVRRFLRERSITLLSEVYRDTKSRIRCQCNVCSWIWPTIFNAVQRGQLCPKCGIRRRAERSAKTHEEVKVIFKRRGITILAGNYYNNRTPLHCECRTCGHRWDTDLIRVTNRSGCPECGLARRVKKRTFTEEFVRRFLQDRGLTLLGEYENSSLPIRCRCNKCRHKWTPSFHSIRSGQGCPKCSGKMPKTLTDYEALARNRGGSIKNMGATAKSRSVWICPKGHGDFRRSYESIVVSGGFCPTCSGKRPKQRADYLMIARKYDGRIKAIGKNSNSPSTWICRRGHEFRRSYTKIEGSGRFCPVCSAKLGERQCKAALEQLFGVPFHKVKVRDLRGRGGGCLELDVFNGDLRLALEHNGPQHYQPVASWGGQKQLAKQLDHDRRRRRYCRRNGITLIEIRELGVVTPLSKLKEIVKTKCVRHGVPLPPNFDSIEVDGSPVAIRSDDEETWSRMKKDAKRLGFVTVSRTYLGGGAAYEFRCKNGHRFTKRPYQIFAGVGCRDCYLLQKAKPVLLSDGRVFESIEQAARALRVSSVAVKYAAENGGKCRSLFVTLVARQHAKVLKTNPRSLRDFYERKWPGHKRKIDLAE